MSALTRMIRRMLRDSRATAMTEFALAAPLLMGAGLMGAETANRAVVQMRMNQLAVLIADNSSRIGQNSLLGEVEIYESDINDIFYGAKYQGGSYLDLYENGRVILSSLEVVPDTDDQNYIHWQRCKGKLAHDSSYGDEGDGYDTGITGMGPAGEEIYAFDDEAVMFVELAYTYQPLITDLFDDGKPIVAIAAFNVRNNRDLSGIKQRDEDNPDTISSCDTYDDFTNVAVIN